MSIDNVQDITPRKQYVATALQTVFPYDFPIFADGDLVVDIDGVIKTITTDYTVSGAGDDNGGNVTLTVGASAGEIVTIYRDIPIERTSDIQQNGPLRSAAINDEFDRLTLVDQQLELATTRAIRVNVNDEADFADLELPSATSRANKYLAFDANGNPTTSAGTGSDSGLREDIASGSAGAVTFVDTVADMKALTGLVDGAIVQPLGYYAVGDYEMRRRRYVSDITPPTDNAGSIIVSNDGLGYFQLDTTDSIDAREFGASESRTAIQNTASIQAAMDVLTESIGFGMVVIGKDIAWTPASITWRANVTVMELTTGEEIKYIANGKNVSGAVNEFIFESGYHPGIILDVYNNRVLDTLGVGQVYSNRASYIIRVNGTGKWQIANDINADGTDHLTIYRLNSSYQHVSFLTNGRNIYGQMSSGGLWTADYSHNFRGASVCLENSTGNLSLVWRLNDNSKRKIITYDTTNDRVEIANTANTAVIWGFDDTGFVRERRGANVASATTITPTGMIFHVTGTTAIATINIPHAGWNGTIAIIPDGIFTTTTAGNIALASTAVVNKTLFMTYDATTAKWYPSY